MDTITLVCSNGEIQVKNEVALESSVIKRSVEEGLITIQVPFDTDIMSKAMAFCEMKLNNATEANLNAFIKENKLVRLMDVAAHLQIDSLIRMTTLAFEIALRNETTPGNWEMKTIEEIRNTVAKLV